MEQNGRLHHLVWRIPISSVDADELRQLLAECTQGNRRAFESLYQRVSGRLLAVALRCMTRRDLAEEVLQESFVRIWHNASHYDGNLSTPMGWMVEITRNQAIKLDNPALPADLAQWQTTLDTLSDPFAEQAAPEHVWHAIEARIDPQELHVPAKRPFWNWLRISAVACSLIIAIIVGVLYSRDTPNYSATLLAANQQPAISVEAYDRYLNVAPRTLAPVATGRSLELWAIPADGKPVSLGLLPAHGKGRIILSESQQKLLSAPVTLAVSLEPEGGSPTAQPTGPVLYQGALAGL